MVKPFGKGGKEGTVLEFLAGFASSLPATARLLAEGNLVVHPAVTRVVLHGSRGLAGGSRADSDVDLSLAVDYTPGDRTAGAALLREVIETSLAGWVGPVALDLAVVFDVRRCRLACFEKVEWNQDDSCAIGGVDCFGLYKTQKGFPGFVENSGVQVRLMHPCLVIWRR